MSKSLDEAAQLVDALLNAAKTGAIIPIRLPGQIEAIQAAISAAKAESSAALAEAEKKAAAAAGGADIEAFQRDQALFFGHAIHELRTPMTSIRGYTDMMIGMGGLNDMQKQFMDTVRANAKRLEALMQDVADMNKIRGGTMKMTAKMDMFKNVALVTEKAMQPTADQLGRKLVFDIPQGLPLLNLDSDLLARALNKLVENALRYHEKEGGEVTVKATTDGNTLVVTVTDNGIGITPEDMEKLGTVYFRSENELVRSYKGSGLGVPVAMGLAKLLGGTVTISSEAGKGTTATMRIPGMDPGAAAG
ncbi:MAG: HAMP domain-containing histidine kinase [Pleurocapsa minor GSE-CHR-MK-17-07R]|jgi:cell cycle sensor histidine kinase DivJ|nr:HAMP domain-containing histidine kinase [Pleurocapsa minor GSE-CHR-MK 17-07R]